jgi:hypothetical protein
MWAWQREKSVKMMKSLTGRCPISDVREPSLHPPDIELRKQRAIGEKYWFPVPRIDFKLPDELAVTAAGATNRRHRAPLTSLCPSHISAKPKSMAMARISLRFGR